MDRLCSVRAARFAAAVIAVVTIAGCPELNQWGGPQPDPFFSVPDPQPESWNVQANDRRNEVTTTDSADAP